MRFPVPRGRTLFSSKICKFFLCIATERKPFLGDKTAPKHCYMVENSLGHFTSAGWESAPHTVTLAQARMHGPSTPESFLQWQSCCYPSPLHPKWIRSFGKLQTYYVPGLPPLRGWVLSKKTQPIPSKKNPKPRKSRKITSILTKQFLSECFVEHAVFHVVLRAFYLVP